MRLRVSPDVLASASEGRHFLTRLETGEVFEMNGTALQVFEVLRSTGSAAAAEAALVASHPDVPPAEIARDVDLLVGRLGSLGLVEPA